LVGTAFALGFILVAVAGAELFTGNNLLVSAWDDRKISTFKFLRSWAIVWVKSSLAQSAWPSWYFSPATRRSMMASLARNICRLLRKKSSCLSVQFFSEACFVMH
jgi:formate/nitrite transporter FocA (FNT family)